MPAPMTASEPAAVVIVGAQRVAVYVDTDADGTPYLQLGGIDCNLEGEQPGRYYPTAVAL